MMLTAFTLFHVALSLAGIVSGGVVVYGLLTSRRLDGWTTFFLITTAATSVTGFLFPVQKFMPSHMLGILSLIALAVAYLGRYRYDWTRTYSVSAVIALYFNVFVLIVQLFEKVRSLKALAPTPSEPPFAIAQLAVLSLFAFLGIRAAMKSGGELPSHGVAAR